MCVPSRISRLLAQCSISVEKRYLLVLLGTICLVSEDEIVEMSYLQFYLVEIGKL